MNKTWKKPKYKIMEKIKIIGNREMKSSWLNSKKLQDNTSTYIEGQIK